MTKELFEKAQFGDRFVTRGGQEALFLRLTENSELQFANFYVKDWGQIRVNRENGKCLNGPDENDIVGMMPSLPSNLDEAAIDAAQLDMQDRQIMEATNDERQRYSRIFRRGFKAGAEWMAGQGATCNGEIQMDFSDPDDIYARRLSADYWNELGPALMKVEPGEVLIQIRKKQ